MGEPWIAFPLHLADIATRVRVYGLSALWLLIAFQYFAWQLPLLMIWDDGVYKRACTVFDEFARPAILAVPYSWCGLRVHTSQFQLMTTMSKRGNALVMTNHCSRIDWLVGMLLGSILTPSVRIGFVAEMTTCLMPVFGWSRFLFGDIFLRRTFHRDAQRISSNIAAFHAARVHRMIFVAPEGAIVDPGIEKDDRYVQQCRSFMTTNLQRPPLKYLLTPRYKGIQILAHHAPDATFSVTMAFACKGHSSQRRRIIPLGLSGGGGRNVIIDPKTSRVTGGELCTRPLDDPLRVVPDLHTIFRGGLHVFCHIHKLSLPLTATNDVIRDLLVSDYERKDNLLEHFHANGTYGGSKLKTLPVNHMVMNLTLIVHSCLSVKLALLCGMDLSRILSLSLMTWLVVSIIHAVSHLYAEQISGASRESLLFETLLKHLLSRCLKNVSNDHGSTTSPSDDSSSSSLTSSSSSSREQQQQQHQKKQQ